MGMRFGHTPLGDQCRRKSVIEYAYSHYINLSTLCPTGTMADEEEEGKNWNKENTVQSPPNIVTPLSALSTRNPYPVNGLHSARIDLWDPTPSLQSNGLSDTKAGILTGLVTPRAGGWWLSSCTLRTMLYIPDVRLNLCPHVPTNTAPYTSCATRGLFGIRN